MKSVCICLGVMGAVMLMAACADDSSSEPTCADITGNWSVTSKATQTDCAPSENEGKPVSISMNKQADGTYVAFIPGVSGGCPGPLDSATCKFTSACEVTINGSVGASFSIEWTFSGKTLSGTEIGRLFPPVVPKSCTGNYSDTGSKI